MADDEILRRLDEHMARGNEIMARSNEIMARSNDVIAENRQALGEFRQALEDVRFELAQMSLRGERVAQGFIAELRAMREEYTQESRAQRQALLVILDQLKGGGPAAAGA